MMGGSAAAKEQQKMRQFMEKVYNDYINNPLYTGSRDFVLEMLKGERLQRALGSSEVGAALADGGELVADVGAALPRGRYDAVVGDMLLEP